MKDDPPLLVDTKKKCNQERRTTAMIFERWHLEDITNVDELILQ